MYEEYFGLKEIPFSVMPDPRYAYRSLGHKIAEGKMRFAADHKSGLAVLTGQDYNREYAGGGLGRRSG
jgi:general secretion pathway protein A